MLPPVKFPSTFFRLIDENFIDPTGTVCHGIFLVNFTLKPMNYLREIGGPPLLHQVAQAGFLDVVMALLQNGADVYINHYTH